MYSNFPHNMRKNMIVQETLRQTFSDTIWNYSNHTIKKSNEKDWILFWICT